MEKIRNAKILGLIGNVLVILSLFMNTVVIKANEIEFKQSFQYIQGDGKFLLVLSLINLGILFWEKFSPELRKSLNKIRTLLIMTVIELIIIIILTVTGGDIGYTEYVSWNWGIGFYSMWIGAVISLISTLLLYKEVQKGK